jgi:DNA-binding beta-propeller fold protein YncE
MALISKRFDGINIKSSPLISPTTSAVDASNVRLDNPIGTLNNDIGSVKYNTRNAGNAILAIAQLKKHGYTNINQTLFSLAGDWWWMNDGDWFYWNFWNNWNSISEPIGALRHIFFDNNTGYIYYTNQTLGTVTKTDITNTYTTILPGFISPQGLYYDYNSDYIFVCESSTGNIIKTKIDGSGWTSLSGFIGAHGISYDNSTGLIYVIEGNILGGHKIVRTLINGGSWTEWGSEGSGINQFESPQGIYLDSNTKDLYISDTNNARIIKTQFGGGGWQSLSLSGMSPIGIGYNSNTGFIYTTDFNGYYIIKTKIDGSGYTTFGTLGSGLNQFNNPYGLFIDPTSGFIFISDTINQRSIVTKENYAFP